MLLLGVVVVALMLTAVRTVHLALKGNYNDVVARVNRIKGIHDVQVYDIDLGFGCSDAGLVSFRITGRPGSYVEILVPNVDLFTSTASIYLSCIGDIEPCVDYGNAGGYANIGHESDLVSILPSPPRNLDELISRYDELEAYFKQWPKYPATHELIISWTKKIEYYRSSRSERFAR
jgi:hypothetical protein